MSVIRKSGTSLPVFPSVFDDLLSREFFNWGNNNFSSTSTTVPAVNIKESADEFNVEVAAPGMEKKDFNITLDGNRLTISSAKQQEEIKKEEIYTRREFSYQSFTRTFQLPKDVVDSEKIMATYENGLLKLAIPKKDEARQKGPRQISIS